MESHYKRFNKHEVREEKNEKQEAWIVKMLRVNTYSPDKKCSL